MGGAAQKAAYAYLKEQILSGTLAASMQIRPEQVAKAVGVSRMPVREALLKLHLEGLVTFGANRRPFVTARSPNQIIELFEIRVALECLAVARAVPHLTETDFANLEAQLKRMDRASSDRPLWVQLHAQFHEMIYKAAGMPHLLAEIARAQEAIQPFLMMYIDLYHMPEMPGVEHTSLLQLLRKRDPNLAATALADHIRSAASGVIYFILSGRHSGGETLSHIDPLPLNMEKR